MDKNEALALLNAIKHCGLYVPPIVFREVDGSPIVRVLMALAAGSVECSVTPVVPVRAEP